MYEKLLEIQKEIKAIKKDASNPFFKSKYFDINSLLAEVKPILNKHGIILMQSLTHINGTPALRTALIMSSRKPKNTAEEESFEIETDLISDVTPLPQGLDPQKTGSAITYFRRYALQSLLALEAEDDDGNVASGKLSTKKGEDVPF